MRASLWLVCLAFIGCQSRLDPPNKRSSAASASSPAASNPIKKESCKLGRTDECKTLCDAGDPLSCATLGQMMLRIGAKIRPREARPLLEEACKDGALKACGLLGIGHLSNNDYDGIDFDPEKALSLLQRACAPENALGCLELARFYTLGGGVPKDAARGQRLLTQAEETLNKSCLSFDAFACYSLGELYRQRPGKIEENEIKAKPLYEKASDLFARECKEKNATSCYLLGLSREALQGESSLDAYLSACDAGHLLACSRAIEMYEEGVLRRADTEAARKLLQRHLAAFDQSCKEGDLLSCFEVVSAFEYGRHVTQNEEKAREVLEFACREGDLYSCEEASDYYDNKNEIERAKSQALLEIACNREDVLSCLMAGESLEEFDAAKAKLLYEKAATLLEEACSFSFADHCYGLSEMYSEGIGVPQDETRSRALGERVISFLAVECDWNIAESCYSLAEEYDSGVVVAPDDARAIALYTKSCELRKYEACDVLAGIYEEGEKGVTEDTEKARSLYRIACENGEPASCESLCSLGEKTYCVSAP
jgi:TPR repeat protein